MKALEFDATVSEKGRIAVPPEIAEEIPAGERLRVIVMWEPADSDVAWRALGRQRFEAAYSPEDVVYDRLTNDPANR